MSSGIAALSFYDPTDMSHRGRITPEKAQQRWAASAQKRGADEYVRQHMLPLLNGSQESFRCLSLPAENWVWEQWLSGLHQDKRFQFFGVEREPEIVPKFRQKAAELSAQITNATFNPIPVPMSLGQAMMSMDEPFDIIYMDFCGPWCDQRYDDLMIMLERKLLKPKGSLILTNLMGMDQGAKQREEILRLGADMRPVYVRNDRAYVDDAEQSDGVPLRCKGIAHLVELTAADAGQSVLTQSLHIYYSYNNQTNRGTPMARLSFTRER